MVTRYLYLLLITIYCLLNVSAYTQAKPQLKFLHIGIEKGLSNNTVNCLLQDKSGFIWVGTDNGLNRYDGYRFVKIGGDNDRNTILSSHITDLFEDVDGMIWIGTKTGGLHRYDPKNGRIEHFINDEKKQPLSNNYIKKICSDNSGALWLGTNTGLTRFDPKTYKTQLFTNTPGDNQSLCFNDVRALCKQKSSGKIWVGTFNGLCLLDPVTNKFLRFPCTLIAKKESPDSVLTPAISSLYEDDKQRLWIGVYGCMLQYLDEKTGKFMQYMPSDDPLSFSSPAVNHFAVDEKGRLWLGTWEDLTLSDAGLNKFYRYTHNNNDPFSLSNNYVTCILKDKNGLMWLGTKGGGLNCFNPFSENIAVLSHRDNDLHSLSSNLVLSIFRDRTGTMWIGTRDGGLDTGRFENGILNVFRATSVNSSDRGDYNLMSTLLDTAKKKLYGSVYPDHNYMVNPTNGGFTIPKADKTNSLPQREEWITACIRDNRQNTWIGTFGRGLNKIDGKTGDFTVFMSNSAKWVQSELSYGGITDIMEAKDGMLWFGTERGLDRYDPATGSFTNYRINESDTGYLTNSLSINFVTKIKEDVFGNIWVGTNLAGLYCLNTKTKKFKPYKVPGNENNQLFSHVNTLCIARDGIIYAGTDGGITVVHPKNDRLQIINTAGGLPDNSVSGILEDRNGQLWISTLNGICIYEPHFTPRLIYTYAIADGFPSDEFLKGACYKDLDGRMYFGNIGGLVSFIPESLKQIPIIAPLIITDLQLFQRSLEPGDSTGILVESITRTKELTLDYDQNFITIAFSSLAFIHNENLEYHYRLVGLNDEWFNTKQGEARYTALPPGTYTFEVKAENASHAPVGESALLIIRIKPPFWQTGWFIVFAAVTVSILIYLFYRWRLVIATKASMKKSAIDRKISELSLTALRSRMNPHFIFNSLSSVQYFIKNMDNEKAEVYVNDLSRLIRAMLQNSDKAMIPLCDELDMLNKYIKLEIMRYGSRFDFEINVSKDIEPESLELPSMLIQPFVENAIVHAFKGMKKKGHIIINLARKNHLLYCTIQDNGIGRVNSGRFKEQNTNHKSIATDDTTSRLDIMNKMLEKNVQIKIIDILDDTAQPLGTCVELYIPMRELF